ELGYFGTGMAEALLNELGHLASLDVIARTSSFSFQNTTAGLAEIAAALAVDYLLEGSVSREADNVFVVAKLVEVSSGRQLWSETFEGTSTRPFSAQRGIAGKVAGYLEMSIGDPEEYGGTSNFEAYDLYLREKTETDQATRRVLLDAALAHDPDFALAMLGKAGLALEGVWQNRKNVDEMWREVQP
ncbi:MAG: hypothetical protein GWM87_14835, partial [Xanthomonadales bacterium]|nr:hypothetical protein [Xanthomonadales bacterium]NIX14070.1 hypothetical protein [Xanthomonadales bacterium]